YADTYVATGDTFYGRVAAETAEWVGREMQSPEGGYYSSLDADSEGHEGKFYVWNRDEVRSALTTEEYEAFAPRFGLDREPNFEGRWHLHVFRSVDDIASTLQRSAESIESALSSARGKLLRIRERRVRPGRDDKILSSWNGLMIRGMAVAARGLGRETLAESAGRALQFVRRTLWRDGRLLATYNDGRAHLNAYLDDYAFLADAVLELQQVRFRPDELQFARDLLEAILGHFADERGGGFFFTSDDHEPLIHRSKSFGDDATPAGNGVAAFALQRMGYLLGETRYLQAAERAVRAGWAVMEKHPQGHTSLLIALEELLHPPEIVVLRGEREIIETWRRELARLYSPRRMVLAVPA
ncbi:MAG: thioredoxin domain-containing protein, partial [Steroidobacteraceae bacterium]